jgi:hypothetical protein
MVVDTMQVTANVEAVDWHKRTITLRGPQGNVTTYKVGDGVTRLNDVKMGDQVVLRSPTPSRSSWKSPRARRA